MRVSMNIGTRETMLGVLGSLVLMALLVGSLTTPTFAQDAQCVISGDGSVSILGECFESYEKAKASYVRIEDNLAGLFETKEIGKVFLKTRKNTSKNMNAQLEATIGNALAIALRSIKNQLADEKCLESVLNEYRKQKPTHATGPWEALVRSLEPRKVFFNGRALINPVFSDYYIRLDSINNADTGGMRFTQPLFDYFSSFSIGAREHFGLLLSQDQLENQSIPIEFWAAQITMGLISNFVLDAVNEDGTKSIEKQITRCMYL